MEYQETIPFSNKNCSIFCHIRKNGIPFGTLSKVQKMNKEQVDQEGLKTRGDILKAVNDLYDESSREDALTGR